MSYVGIDYGMGKSNRDPANGIRYGVISQHSVLQAWADSSEPVYGDPTCPKCGNKAVEYNSDDHEKFDNLRGGCDDYACVQCGHSLDSEDCFGDEPLGWEYKDEGYELTDCLDSDIFVLKSPFYTFAQFCSPCVPGAGNLNHPMEDGVQCYCLGHDWFEDGKATYPVYRVSDGERVITGMV